MRNYTSFILVAAALLAALWLTPASAAGSDRIFANGFDPCCQIGGTVSGLSGSGLVLHLIAGAVAENRAIHQDGLYNFVASVPPNTAWTVTIKTHPGGQICQLANASGTMGSSNVDNVNVTCGRNALIWDEGHWDDGEWQ